MDGTLRVLVLHLTPFSYGIIFKTYTDYLGISIYS